MNITEFVIDNCVRQSATEPKDYIGMTRAVVYAANCLVGKCYHLNINNISLLGSLVNNTPAFTNKFRTTNVTFANGNMGVAPSQIERLIEQLLQANREGRVTPEEFYWEFERIHPFPDGNGRVGAILYSLLKQDLWINPPEMTW